MKKTNEFTVFKTVQKRWATCVDYTREGWPTIWREDDDRRQDDEEEDDDEDNL